MSYPKKLLRLRPTRGFISDTPPHEISNDYYSAVENVIFREGFAQRVPGFRSAYETALGVANPTSILHALNAENSGTNYWLIFEPDGTAWALEGSNATQIDNSLLQAVSNPYQFSSSRLNSVPVISNGADEPVFWGGVNLATLTDWIATETCQFITAFKFHLFALDISGPGGEFPSLLKWSDAAEPGTIPSSWTPAADNEAGDAELADSPGALLCAYPLRDSLLIYKRSAIYAATYVGGNNIFNIRKLQSAFGALTRRSVCDVGGGKHLVVTDGDIVLTDGTNRQAIGEARVKDFLFGQLSQDNFLNVFCAYNRAKGEVLIGFPQEGNEFANLALVYDVERDSFGSRTLAAVAHAPVGIVDDQTPSNTWADRTDTWAEATDRWGRPTISSATDSMLHVSGAELIQQDTQDSVAMNASLTKENMTFGEPERVKFIKRVHVRANDTYGTLLVRVGARMEPGGAIAWSPEVSITAPEQIVNTFAQGRYISIQVRTIGSDVWQITALELEAELRGYF